MRIRSARADDFETCLNLDASYETESAWQMEEQYCDGEWRITFREVSLPRKQHVTPLHRTDERLEAWQRCDGFWLAVERRKIRGYVALALEPTHRQARITDLVVAPPHRRAGIGTALLEHATARCLRRGMDQLILECSLKAHPAISFLQRRGFTPCGFQDAYWPGQEVGLFFRKRIR